MMTMKWLGGCAAIVTFCIMAGTATATTAAAPTCANDICHIRAIKGSVKLLNVAYNCAAFSSSPSLTNAMKTAIVGLLPPNYCGIASERNCSPNDMSLSCVDLTMSSSSSSFTSSNRRLLSNGNSIDLTYTIAVGDSVDTSVATSTLSNITTVSSVLSSASEFSGTTVSAGTSPTSVILDSASNRAVCKGFSLFPSPSAGGASAGNCTDPMFGGDVCSPVCDSHSTLTRSTTCSEAGVVQQAICTEKTCTCSNGVASTRSSCNVHGEEQCSNCHDGYHLDNGKCVQNVCHCLNGVPKSGVKCTDHDVTHCDACNAGYHINGSATKATCVACAAGHYQNVGNFSGTSCEACAKGTAVQGIANTACTPCIAGATGTYTDQRGQSACKPQPTVAELPCPHSQVLSEPKTTESRKCVLDCGALKHHYEKDLGCHTACKVPGSVASTNCTKTRTTYRELLCPQTHCRRRRTRL